VIGVAILLSLQDKTAEQKQAAGQSVAGMQQLVRGVVLRYSLTMLLCHIHL
jgi:hypothetical protein